MLMIFLLFLVYFSPSIVAFFRKHPKGGTLFLVNLCLGWTVVGWIFTMLWAWIGGKSPD